MYSKTTWSLSSPIFALRLLIVENLTSRWEANHAVDRGATPRIQDIPGSQFRMSTQKTASTVLGQGVWSEVSGSNCPPR